MLINFGLPSAYGQSILKKDSLIISDSTMKDIIKYSAKDSLYTNIKEKIIYLYGDAKVEMESIKMNAGFILIDLNKNEIMASYIHDADSVKIQKPVFSDGKEEINAERIRYNLKSKKGYIEETKIQQDEIYINMHIAKRHKNEEIHFIKGRFSTCDLDDPHYHFNLTKAIMIPDDKIVTGPMNLWVKGVPTPLGLPFSVLPQQTPKKEGSRGFIFPEIAPSSPYGFGFQNLGYFIPINNNIQTTIYANLYSRGSWGLRNEMDYSKRYGYIGNFSIGFQQFRSGFPENENRNKFSINWRHNKDAKSNPFWKFNTNVNFISDNNSQNSLDPINPEYFTNSFNSDININRLFPGKPISTGLKISLRQNSLSNNISLTSPVFNFNLNRVFPFKSLIKVPDKEWKKALKRIGVTYSMEGQNRSSFSDSLLSKGDFESIRSKFFNGFSQQFLIQTSIGLFQNTIKINPSISYGNKINFQQITKTYDATLNDTKIDTINKTGMAHDLSINASLTTALYNYYRFIGKREPLLRHIMTPTIGYRYIPMLNELITSNAGPNQSEITYSPFERSLYQSSTGATASLLTFGVNNTFELKRKSEIDTSGYKKTRLIDQLSLTGNYNFEKDSMNLSNISINLRISPTNWINIVTTNQFSPYSWNLNTGEINSDYAIKNNQGLGRFTNSNLTTTLTLAPSKSREKIKETVKNINEDWNADFNFYALHPEQLILFDIPWKINLSHVLGLNANTNKSTSSPDDYNVIHTIVATGDISFTKRWKIAANINFDLKELDITNAFFTLSRDMHCWALSFYWTPIGTNQSFLLSIKNKSTILRDAKLEFRKPPAFL